MGSGRGDTRAELSRLLHADAPPSEDGPKPPDEASSAHLAALIALGTVGSNEDQRAVYEHLPLLMLRFFGFTPGSGWLETGSSMAHPHREALMDVVRPSGPVAEYCAARSPPVASEPKDDEWRFEYPLSNLPPMLVDEFCDVADHVAAHLSHFLSALAPLLGQCLRRGRDGAADVLLLSPMDYFLMCMVASPTQKWTLPAGAHFPGAARRPRPRRSASLPSTRAMYNLVLAEHVTAAWRASPRASGGGGSLLIPACIDCLFGPATGAVYPVPLEPSTPTVDAMASVLLALRPGAPADLLLASGVASGSVLYPGKEQAVALLYATAQDVLRHSLAQFPVGSNAPQATLAAYVRLLALYLAPGSESVAEALRAMLYPKPRAAQVAAGTSPSLAAITSRLSSLNAQFQLPTSTLRGGAATAGPPRGDAAWRGSTVLTSRHEADRELLRLAVVKCANCRVGATSEGIRALTLLSAAVQACGLDKYDRPVADDAEESRGCLHALSDQAAEVEARLGRKSGRAFVCVLGAGLGVKVEAAGGVLSGMAGMVGVRASMGSGGGGGSGGSAKRRLRERRRRELRGAGHDDIPFLGSVWDRPIEAGESEAAVVLAYRLSSLVEERTGWRLDIRFLGRYSFLLLAASVLLAAGMTVRMAG